MTAAPAAIGATFLGLAELSEKPVMKERLVDQLARCLMIGRGVVASPARRGRYDRTRVAAVRNARNVRIAPRPMRITARACGEMPRGDAVVPPNATMTASTVMMLSAQPMSNIEETRLVALVASTSAIVRSGVAITTTPMAKGKE